MTLQIADSMEAQSLLIVSYLDECKYLQHLLPQVDGAIALAQTRAPHSESAQHAVLVLQDERVLLERACSEGHAWRSLVLTVVARIGAAVASKEAVASHRVGRVEVCLALSRACYAALDTLGAPSCPARQPLDGFCTALLAHVHVLIAQQLAADRATTGRPRGASRKLATPVGDDGTQAALAALGCAPVLRNLQQQPLNELLAAAQEALRCIDPMPTTMEEAVMLSAACGAVCALISARSSHLLRAPAPARPLLAPTPAPPPNPPPPPTPASTQPSLRSPQAFAHPSLRSPQPPLTLRPPALAVLEWGATASAGSCLCRQQLRTSLGRMPRRAHSH